MKRTENARRLIGAGIILVAALVVVAIIFWSQTQALVQRHDAAFKLVGYVIGPLLAILGFFWGLLDKAELKDYADERARAEEKAKFAEATAVAAQAAVDEKIDRIVALERDLATIADSRRLWKLRANAPFREYTGWKFNPSGAKIVTIGLFKGGVGKTHLTSNFAAYISEKQKKPVLLVDLDYQGSLSTSVLRAAGHETTESKVDRLFDAQADLATLIAARIQLAPRGGDATLNGGAGLARAWIAPADYTLSDVEARLLIDSALNGGGELDERYRLAHVLLHPAVRQDYAMIIIDTPPRMTLGTVNALVASHFVVMPTIYDRVSSEAVRPFLEQVQLLAKDLDLDLRLAGIVGTLTRRLQLSEAEEGYRDQVRDTAIEVLGVGPEIIVPQNLPQRAAIQNEMDFGYFLADGQGRLRDSFYDAIFDELWTRIIGPQESR